MSTRRAIPDLAIASPTEEQAARYPAVQAIAGRADPFRLRHRNARREVDGAVIRGRMDEKQASAHVGARTREQIDPEEREPFQEAAESGPLSLHEGTFARYQIRPSEFAAWREVWSG